MEAHGIKKGKTMLSFFKRKEPTSTSGEQSLSNVDTSNLNSHLPCKSQRIEIDLGSLERDPALRIPIWKQPVNQRDEIRRAYIKMGPYQPVLPLYPATKFSSQNRRFQSRWYKQFTWLEYSLSEDKAFCFPCFLFENELARHSTFTIKAVKSVDDLMNVKCHIAKIINVQSFEEKQKNRLRLTTTIESVCLLCMQACAFRGHDESPSSTNRGNVIEVIKSFGRVNPSIKEIFLENAPQSAQYISPTIQKEILRILANQIRNKIRNEVGDAKFCILVDEAKDVSDKEQMAIILRYVDANGILLERFFEIVEVNDTTAATLKKAVCDALGRSNLDICNLRGQGYDGASNMRGAWNGLQALFLKYSPYAYYVHCFAHRLQLALVAACEKELSLWKFFSGLNCIVNLITASSKRQYQLRFAQDIDIQNMVATGERGTGRGANQIGNLQRPGKTRWSSHFESSNAMSFVKTTKELLQSLRDNSFDIILMQVESVCSKYGIEIPNMDDPFKFATGRSCQQKDTITVKHHYHFDVFNSATDFQLEELNSRFGDDAVELLSFSAALEPKDNFKLFNVDQMCTLATKFYPGDFSDQEIHYLSCQLRHYERDIPHHAKFQDLTTISELCRRLMETNMAQHFNLIDRLIRLVLTLPVSTASVERAFSAMKLVKTILRNKMGEGYLADSMVIYVERELAQSINNDSIIDDFDSLNDRRAQL